MADDAESGLVALLQSLSPAPAGGRIYPQLLPPNPTMPAITFRRVFAGRGRSLSGPNGHARPFIYFQVWGDTYKEAKDAANALRQALDGYTGTAGNITLRDSKLETDEDVYEDGARYHSVRCEYSFSHVES